ncbi:MAG: endonuclease [endosymbiont of Galathealinum brachiosum]|uniref:Endonuclease n=1 Tax=endosymbiont of Galathealinum brachiosum TaxID=2200906 RepID=A0A370DG40_9GAMM|nr:MAG: endonuclease [endosymbiont of Galathealinum brachiosum]
MSWYVYLLHCADDSYYTGITTDPKRRLHEHNEDNNKAAKYTRARRPLKMVYFDLCDSRSDAASREYEIRKLSRKKKVDLAHSMRNELDGL